MFECSIVIENNGKKLKRLIPLERGGTVRIYFSGDFDGTELAKVFSKLKSVISTYGKGCRTILFICKDAFEPSDEFTYIMLECVLYTLKYKYGYEVKLYISKKKENVNAPGLSQSLLPYFYPGGQKEEELKKRYYKDYTSNHFRRVIGANDASQVSILLGDLKTFFKVFNMKKDYGEEIAKVVTELVDNACEHTGSDCLADVFVSSPKYRKRGEEDGSYYAISVVVLNFSNKLLCTDIQNKIKNREYSDSKRYEKVYDAYKNHQEFFDKRGKYNEDDFFNIASFQHSISGRKYESETGGKGLTQLIKSLEDKAEDHTCYVLSGHQGIHFEPGFLEYNTENWIGFNEEKDFLNCRPNQDIILRSSVNFLGTGYNFTLIVKEEVV